jgi:hypothetical protein
LEEYRTRKIRLFVIGSLIKFLDIVSNKLVYNLTSLLDIVPCISWAFREQLQEQHEPVWNVLNFKA